MRERARHIELDDSRRFGRLDVGASHDFLGSFAERRAGHAVGAQGHRQGAPRFAIVVSMMSKPERPHAVHELLALPDLESPRLRAPAHGVERRGIDGLRPGESPSPRALGHRANMGGELMIKVTAFALSVRGKCVREVVRFGVVEDGKIAEPDIFLILSERTSNRYLSQDGPRPQTEWRRRRHGDEASAVVADGVSESSSVLQGQTRLRRQSVRSVRRFLALPHCEHCRTTASVEEIPDRARAIHNGATPVAACPSATSRIVQLPPRRLFETRSRCEVPDGVCGLLALADAQRAHPRHGDVETLLADARSQLC